MIKFILFTLAIPFFSACNQNSDDQKKIEALSEEKSSESDSESNKDRNFLYNHTNIIRDSVTAIKISEAILFGIYGKDEITEQKPYFISFKDNFWTISGSLPAGYLGGTFLIEINAKNGEVVQLTHGK